MSEALNVVPLPEGSVGRQRVVERLEQLLEQARAGRYIGFVYVVEEEGNFGWGKVNVTYPHGLAMLQRATHHLNKEWDEAR